MDGVNLLIRSSDLVLAPLLLFPELFLEIGYTVVNFHASLGLSEIFFEHGDLLFFLIELLLGSFRCLASVRFLAI